MELTRDCLNDSCATDKTSLVGASESRRVSDLTLRRRMLRMVGAEVAGPTPAEFNGLHVERWPLVSWSPSFAQARSSRGADSCRICHADPAGANMAASSYTWMPWK